MTAEISAQVPMTAPGGTVKEEEGQTQPSGNASRKTKPASWKRRLGLFLVVLSCLLYGCLFLVSSTSLSTEGKVALSSLLVISGEASFWIGGLILGREAIARWRGGLDPRRWIRGRA
jgi:hypothetical protein